MRHPDGLFLNGVKDRVVDPDPTFQLVFGSGYIFRCGSDSGSGSCLGFNMNFYDIIDINFTYVSVLNCSL
jgi:hypothetical protein